jgi:ApeA N-terminal domain 1
MTVLEERGFFWWSDEQLPENQFAPDGSIPGLLTIDDDGRITLELDSYFPNEHGPFGVLTDQGVVLKRNLAGILKTSNDRVLLIGVIPSGGQARTAGVSYQRFISVHALVGDFSVHKMSAPVFDALAVDLAGFEAWFWFRSIVMTREENRISAEWRRPDAAVYRFDDETLIIE